MVGQNLLIVATDLAADEEAFSTKTPTNSPASQSSNNLTRYALWSEPRDVWCVKIDPLWIDFLGARSVGQTKTVPFVDAVPITLWVHGRTSSDQNANPIRSPATTPSAAPQSNPQPDPFVLSVANLQRSIEDEQLSRQNIPPFTSSNPFFPSNNCVEPTSSGSASEAQCKATLTDDEPAMADLHVIAHISNLVSVQIDHYQFLFLLRLAEEMTELTTFLSLDSNRIMQNVSYN